MPAFSYITSLQAEQALALRLNDTSNIHWAKAELNLYICEALREYNALTATWVADWSTQYTQPNPATLPTWNSTGNNFNSLVGNNPTSPRYQALTDAYLYTVAQYHLLEPPTGNGTWTGTSQFSLADFTQALQRRRDQILQATDCNVGPFSNSLSLAPGGNRVLLPDTVLDMRRVRYVPSQGSPATLFRSDGLAFEYFTNDFEQIQGQPLEWDVLASPQLAITFDANANLPNTLDCLSILAGPAIIAPTASPLLIPDDWSWVLKWGMIADLLSKEVESIDPQRAAYCLQRFEEGIKLMKALPWLMQARIDNVPVDAPSVYEMDEFSYEWQSTPSIAPQIVRGGIDLFAMCPVLAPGVTQSVTMVMVGNAPVPATDSDEIQVSRDVLDAVLDEAQHLAMFKDGFSDLEQSMALHKNFIRIAVETNSRLEESGIFDSTLRPPVSRADEASPRFAMTKE
jgi:hypothetical protein